VDLFVVRNISRYANRLPPCRFNSTDKIKESLLAAPRGYHIGAGACEFESRLESDPACCAGYDRGRASNLSDHRLAPQVLALNLAQAFDRGYRFKSISDIRALSRTIFAFAR